jgi:hypothetical protein
LSHRFHYRDIVCVEFFEFVIGNDSIGANPNRHPGVHLLKEISHEPTIPDADIRWRIRNERSESVFHFDGDSDSVLVG